MSQDLSTSQISEIMFDPFAMLAVTRRLSRVLAQEVELLKDMRIAEVHTLYNDKMELIAILEGYKEALIQQPELLNSIPKRLLDDLRSEAVTFEVLIEEDNKQITRAKEVHKLIMEAVKKALEQNNVKNSGYNKKGLIDMGSRQNYITPPVSINENI